MSRISWLQNTPYASTTDTDHDGICDALDNYNGHGASAPSWMLDSPAPSTVSSFVSWNQHSPLASTTDSDHDGICDALDDHFGPGA